MSATNIGQGLEPAIRHGSRRAGHHRRLIVLHDLLAAAVSFPAAMLLRVLDDPAEMREALPTLIYGVPLFVACSAAAFGLLGLHRAFWRYATASELLAIFKAAACAILMFLAALFLIERLASVPRAVPVIHWFVLVGLLCGSRLMYAAMITPLRERRAGAVRHSEWEPVLVAGASGTAASLIQLLGAPGRSRFEVAGLLDDRPYALGRAIHDVPVLGRLADLPQAVARLSVHGVKPRRLVLGHRPEWYDGEVLARLYESAERLGLSVHGADEFIGLVVAEGQHQARAGSAPPAADRQASLAIKRSTDVAGALALLVVTAPVMLLLAALVWVGIGRPAFFYQIRPGKDLRPFKLRKFRSLKDGDTPDGRVLPDEERRTLVGDLLRRTRLDELPQLWNVLVGDMSLIGPRPLLTRDLPELGGAVHERFRVRPGITGWAQVNGGHQLTTDQKLALDLWYIRNQSPWLDAKILAGTVRMMVFGERVNEVALQHAGAVGLGGRASGPARGREIGRRVVRADRAAVGGT